MTTEGELEADLRRLDMDAGFVSLVMKEQSFSAIGIGAPVIVLPRNLLQAVLGNGVLDEESLTAGLRQSIAQLRRGEPTALLAESLLSLARAGEGAMAPGDQLALILEAIAVLRQVDAPHRMPRAYVALSNVLKKLGRPYDALAALDSAADAEREHPDTGALLAVHYERAVVLRLLGLHAEALSELDHATEALRAIGLHASAEIWALRIRSESLFCLTELRRDEEALAEADAWLASSPRSRDITPVLARADVLRSRSGVAAAVDDYLEAAIRAAQDISQYSSTRFRRTARDRYDQTFTRSIGALIEAARHTEALAAWEMAGSGVALLPRDDDAYSQALDDGSRDEVMTEALRLGRHARAALAADDRLALDACQEQADWLLFRHDMLGRTAQPRVASRELVDAWAAEVHGGVSAGTLLLSYAAIGERACVFAVTSDSVVCEPLEVPRREMALLTRSAARECRGLFPTDALDESARRLLEPVSRLVEDAETIVIVPCVELHGLPFHAMRPLRGKAVTYSTRAVDLRLGRAEREPPLSATSRWTGLGVSSVAYSSAPELGHVRTELREIGAHFTSPTVVVDPPATAADLLSPMGHADVLHIACHAAFESTAPHLSRLLFADRPVFSFEIAVAPLDAAHVVLSACETADAAAHQGGHIQSLTSAFLTAGASGVTGSLWPVDDWATARFLTTLYERRMSTGASMADALDWTRSVFAEEAPHPHYWAPFVHIGAPGADR